MFDLQFVTRSFVFLLTFAKPLGLESKYFVRNPTKDDVLLVHANAIDVYDTDNLMSCAVNCNLEDMCLSFGFNEYTLSCVHIKKKIAELNFGNNEVGWSYFQIGRHNFLTRTTKHLAQSYCGIYMFLLLRSVFSEYCSPDFECQFKHSLAPCI